MDIVVGSDSEASMEPVSKSEAIQRVRKEAAIDIARMIISCPNWIGLTMAARIEACADFRMRSIAAYTEPKPGEVIAVVGPRIRTDG
jgi:hypothetical protein